MSVNELTSPKNEAADLRRLAEELTAAASQRAEGPQITCPADQRIEAFLADYFSDQDLSSPLRLPENQIPLSRPGIANELALPQDEDEFANEYVTSYRVRNGVLHNPRHDRRTTEGTFHVVEGGLPIPGDKKAVPKNVFVRLFRAALEPPADLALIPFTAHRPVTVHSFVSLMLRPMVCPEVPGVCSRRSLEVRFFAPGSLVSNLDFVERIFGNAGDPWRPKNDAGLDVEGWTGHTGCVILAPHVSQFTKKELGLPHHDEATERQRRDGMCWREPGDLYNNGQAFKLTCRSHAGVMVTLIADNYFGYCKKEVKTQISYAANLSGNLEEEHAGGALAYASYSLGYEFDAARYAGNTRTFEDVAHEYAESIEVRPAGYGIDRRFPDLIYIPHDAKAGVTRQAIWWTRDGLERSIPLLPGKTYMTPSGYKVHLEKHPAAQSWRLIGTVAEGLFCHKPCTVSGGGKSEISKSLLDYMVYGPIFVADVEKDFDLVQKIFDRDYADRWKPGRGPNYEVEGPSRPVLSPERSVGSVIKLLTPSEDYTKEYNDWLGSFPSYIYPIVFIIKRFIPTDDASGSSFEDAVVWLERLEAGGHRGLTRWRQHFGVDFVNGFPGHELKAFGRKLVGTYLRVGLLSSQGWRTFKVRQDFAASAKVQTEDDITASVVVAASALGKHAKSPASRKFAANCESRLFQRPDDAVHRGLDRQTELDLARTDNFVSNFEPLTAAHVRGMLERVVEFDDFTSPMQRMLRDASEAGYVVCSANPRIVDGKPSKNPRYLQIRPDLVDSMPKYVAERGARFARELPPEEPLYQPVDAVLIGRRNNPPDVEAGIRPLAVYGPIHYQELPELFMDFICSLTGKSPSTTGAGSEGALTKGPFNALRPIVDLNNALVSYALTGLGGFSTAAGYVGPTMRVDHDISLLIPEIWCRMSAKERDPAFLIKGGYLERVEDREYDGRPVLASRLGYRITDKFVGTFLGRVFDNPSRVFDEAFLRPETQDLTAFVDGVHNITEAQQRVAAHYFEDGSIEDACPPLRVLLTIMAHGAHEGRDVHHPEVREMFRLESIRASDWYRDRLVARRKVDEDWWAGRLQYLEAWLKANPRARGELRAEIQQRLQHVEAQLRRVQAPEYSRELDGTLGLDPSLM